MNPFDDAVTMLANHGMSEADALNWVQWRGIARALVVLRKNKCCRGKDFRQRYQCKGNTTMDDKIEITGMDRNEILAALCNGTAAQGMSALDPKAMDRITAAECAKEFEDRPERNGVICFDYVFGKPVKVNFVTEGDKLFLDRTRLYDRDAGHGKAQEIISLLKREPL